MSSTLTVHGTLTFPPGGIAAFLAASLVVDDGEFAGESCFDVANDLGSVREVLTDAGDCWIFVRFVVDGDALHVRAALGDDFWCAWCGRIRALAAAAARLGARGCLEAEDDGSYMGRLAIRRRRAVYEPRSRAQPEGTDHAGLADLSRIWREVTESLTVTKKTAKKKTAKKKTAKKKTAKKR